MPPVTSQKKDISKPVYSALESLEAARAGYDKACKQFGKDFRLMREAAGVSLSDLAEKLKLSKAYLSDVELGRRNPNATILNTKL